MQTQNQTKFQFELNLDQINVCLEALMELPFKKVESIIREIHTQVSPQLNPQSPIQEDKGE